MYNRLKFSSYFLKAQFPCTISSNNRCNIRFFLENTCGWFEWLSSTKWKLHFQIEIIDTHTYAYYETIVCTYIMSVNKNCVAFNCNVNDNWAEKNIREFRILKINSIFSFLFIFRYRTHFIFQMKIDDFPHQRQHTHTTEKLFENGIQNLYRIYTLVLYNETQI